MSENKKPTKFIPLPKGEINDDLFWALVEALGWGRDGNFDYAAMRRRIMDNYTATEAAELVKLLSKKSQELWSVLEQDDRAWQAASGGTKGYGLSDDSFGDLVKHCIGLGQSFYNEVLRDPIKHARPRATRHGFTESFSYAFPYNEDYETNHEEAYVKKAAQYREEILSGWNEVKNDGWQNERAEEAVKVVSRILEMIEQGDFAEAVGLKASLKYSMDTLRRLDVKNVRWGPDNLLSDIEANWL